MKKLFTLMVAVLFALSVVGVASARLVRAPSTP